MVQLQVLFRRIRLRFTIHYEILPLFSKILFNFFPYLPVFNLFAILYSFILNFLLNRKTPETLRFRGILRLDTRYLTISNLYYLSISDYSMIVATRPDPTVRPPSRYQTGVSRCANGDFSFDLWGKIRIFRCVRMIFGDFVIMVLSSPLNNTMIHNLCNTFCTLYNFFFSPFFLVFIFFYKFFHCCILRFWVSYHF